MDAIWKIKQTKSHVGRVSFSWCQRPIADTTSGIHGARIEYGASAHATERYFPGPLFILSLNSVLQLHPKMARVFQGPRPWLRTLCQLCWVEARNRPRVFQRAFSDLRAKGPSSHLIHTNPYSMPCVAFTACPQPHLALRVASDNSHLLCKRRNGSEFHARAIGCHEMP